MVVQEALSRHKEALASICRSENDTKPNLLPTRKQHRTQSKHDSMQSADFVDHSRSHEAPCSTKRPIQLSRSSP